VPSPKLSCDVKRLLLHDYIAALEKVKVARREQTSESQALSSGAWALSLAGGVRGEVGC
jgi:hypothetical protein